MALIFIQAPDGKGRIAHSSEFGPQYVPTRSTGSWGDVWERVEARKVPVVATAEAGVFREEGER